MGQSRSIHSPTTSPTLSSPSESHANPHKSSRPRGLLKRFKRPFLSRKTTTGLPRTNKSCSSGSSVEQQRLDSTATALSGIPESNSDESASSAPSSLSISSSQTESPTTSHNSCGTKDKASVVAVSASPLEGPGEPSGADVLTPTRNLSRRSSRPQVPEQPAPAPSEASASSISQQVEEPSPLSPHVSTASEEIRTPPITSSTSPTHQTLNTSQPTPPGRQPFPPPGTLVLVQGVVQTTDTPRANTDNSTETSRSTLDPSLSNVRPVSRNGSPPSSTGLPISSDSTPVPEAITHPEHDTAEPAVSTAPGEQQPTTEGNSVSPATPPNGVEVLGTLLSVAAAATAASLLAGSTENILSPPRHNSAVPSRNGEVPDLSPSARRERMRHAWQSVRERLGLRPSPPSSMPPTDGQQVDAREVMLAEMARAFNLGLGIGPENDDSVTPNQASAQLEPDPTVPQTPPPPGSFEHFLSDLQTDLRGVLNEAEGRTNEEVEQTAASLPETSLTALEPTAEEPDSAESTDENRGQNSSRNVNWWRMYRFPAMNPRNGMPTPAENNTTNVAPAPTLNAPVSPTLETPATPNVVPIVVVGLRSVNLPGQTPEPPAATPGSSPTESGPMPGSWPSRAASALRNIRPSGQSEPRQEAQNNGAPRTFLIFVIGGYYPPDHTMVTGGENSLASFEALLELAEMFGQAKPQTASRNDIERSGLEIIKANTLPKYEQEGRISSNCTDRCLICLDDYDPEDPVRIMSCRHGFHKTCVDRWLETGRNNCPACRSAGVSNMDGGVPTL